jgi:hypothetical protein
MAAKPLMTAELGHKATYPQIQLARQVKSDLHPQRAGRSEVIRSSSIPTVCHPLIGWASVLSAHLVDRHDHVRAGRGTAIPLSSLPCRAAHRTAHRTAHGEMLAQTPQVAKNRAESGRRDPFQTPTRPDSIADETEERAEVRYFQKAGDVYCGVG